MTGRPSTPPPHPPTEESERIANRGSLPRPEPLTELFGNSLARLRSGLRPEVAVVVAKTDASDEFREQCEKLGIEFFASDLTAPGRVLVIDMGKLDEIPQFDLMPEKR